MFEPDVTWNVKRNYLINKLTASGIPNNFSVVLVINPSVPSDPTNKFVKLYPAAVFLK